MTCGVPSDTLVSSSLRTANPQINFTRGIDTVQRYTYDINAQAILRRRGNVTQTKDFVSVRLDQELKAELLQAAELERRSLSSLCRLLLEYAWGQYLKAGSMRELLSESPHERTKHRSSK